MDDAKHPEAPPLQRYARFLRYAARRTRTIDPSSTLVGLTSSFLVKINIALEKSPLGSDSNPPLTASRVVILGWVNGPPCARRAWSPLLGSSENAPPHLFHLSERSTALIAAAGGPFHLRVLASHSSRSVTRPASSGYLELSGYAPTPLS